MATSVRDMVRLSKLEKVLGIMGGNADPIVQERIANDDDPESAVINKLKRELSEVKEAVESLQAVLTAPPKKVGRPKGEGQTNGR